MATKNTKSLEKLIEFFTNKGGKINPYYLNYPRKTPVLVFYKRWYRGRNLLEAIKRALAG